MEGSIDDVSTRAQAVLREFNVTMDAESSERGGDEREFKGKRGDLDVTVKLERRSPTTTQVEVEARENVAEWDKEFARDVLARIVEQG